MGLLDKILERVGYEAVPEVRMSSNDLNESLKKNSKLHTDDFKGGANLDHVTAMAYSAIYSKVSTQIASMYRDIDIASNSYLIDVIIDIICEYALSPDISTDEILEISSDDKVMQKEIEILSERFDFDKIAMTLCRDLVKYGSYYIQTEVKNVATSSGETENNDPSSNGVGKIVEYKDRDPKANGRKRLSSDEKDSAMSREMRGDEISDKEYGLIRLVDEVDQSAVVPLSDFGTTVGYLYKDTDSHVKYQEASDFIEFALDGKKLRIDMSKEFFNSHKEFKRMSMRIEEEHGYIIPRYIRKSKSIIWPVLSKVKELDLLEKLVPASKLSKLSNGSLLSVMVPEKMDITEALEAMETIEGLINKQKGISISNGEQLTAEAILNTSSSIKCVPNFGGATGALDVVATRSDEPDDLLASATDIRALILSSVGVPSELVFLNDNGDKKEILKRYARFLRQIRGIQKAITNGFKQIVLVHLANRYRKNEYKFSEKDIIVNFKNKLVEVDALDALEFSDTVIQTTNNIKEAVFSLTEPDSPLQTIVDYKVFAEKIAELYEKVGLEGVIDPKKYKEMDVQDDEDDSDRRF